MASRPTGMETVDVEENALGTLQEKQYMLIPNNCNIPQCPVNHVGAGISLYDPGSLAISGVYALAKAQAIGFGWDNDKAIKWAVLRMQALCVGWFDHQKYTVFKEAPSDCETTFVEDKKKIDKIATSALELSKFLPFLAEFQFRAYGTSYQKTNNRAEYVRVAQEFATSYWPVDMLTYMDNDTLFGSALLWVDVKRPMEVLKDPEACSRIPYMFVAGKKAAPAGQSLIATSVAVIDSLKSVGWWSGIKEAGRYEDEKLITVFDKITSDSWKYHIMHQAYGIIEELSTKEVEEVEEGKKLAILFAPVLQAYVDALAVKGDLGKAEALKEHAYAYWELYSRALEEFEIAMCCDATDGLFDSKSFEPEKIFLIH